ncbi:LysR family transcriptional regulator [Mesobacillus harenae]|uniref:LysR family transcriptional regulator n=1 Tax=Mesobacillus harenae TaxID=2213203 RepID=UPI0015812B3C|nr:LysR family transcriptional regulator [Mesobacillus harenae]
MRIEQLEYLVAISRSGSFSEAAAEHHITQPTISQAINSLEVELETKIFHRSRKGAEATTEGKIVIKKAHEILSKLNELKEDIKLHSESLTGSLKLAMVPSACSALLPKTLANFKAKYPLVHIEIIEEGSQHVNKDVLVGNVDFGVIAIQSGTWNEDASLHFEELIASEVKVCVGKSIKLENQGSITLSEIIKQPIIMFKSGYNMSNFMINLLSDYGNLNILFTSDNTEIAKKVIVEGVAIGFFTELSLKNDPYLLNGDLIALDIKDYKRKITLGLIRSKNKHFSKAAEEFVKELIQQAKVYHS